MLPQVWNRTEGAKARQTIPPDIIKQAVDKVLHDSAIHTTAKVYGLSKILYVDILGKSKGMKVSNFSYRTMPIKFFLRQRNVTYQNTWISWLEWTMAEQRKWYVNLLTTWPWKTIKNILKVGIVKNKQVTFGGRDLWRGIMNYNWKGLKPQASVVQQTTNTTFQHSSKTLKMYWLGKN